MIGMHLPVRSLLRIAAVSAALVLSVASTQRQAPSTGPHNTAQPPAPQAMSAQSAVGLWRTSFGPVKIQLDTSKPGNLMGVWVYKRSGQEVIGYFGGVLRGNVLQFTWQEPSQAGGAPLTGSGWLAFGVQGQRFSGRWWTTRRDRQGDWTGWRPDGRNKRPTYDRRDPYGRQPAPNGQAPYGGQNYGRAPAPYGGQAPYGGNNYGRAPAPYGGQTYGGAPSRGRNPFDGSRPGGTRAPSSPPGPPPAPRPRVYQRSI